MGDPFTTAIIITVAIAIFTERAKKEYGHTRDKAAAEFSRAHPDWSSRKVMRHAKRRARGYWWDQISNGFPEYRRAHAETRDLAEAERAEAEVGWMKRRADLRKRVDDALREKDRLQREATKPDEMPEPLTGDVKPEDKVDAQAPETPGPMPEALKPPPAKPAPAVNDKEEVAYQQYAMRRRNGSKPQTDVAVADALGVDLAAAQAIRGRWESRYKNETVRPVTPTLTINGDTITAPMTREQSEEFARTHHCTGCGSDRITPVLDEAARTGGFEVDHNDDCPKNTTVADGTPRQEHDRKVAEIADAVAPQPESVSPITKENSNVSVNAETTGLTTAIAYADGMASSAEEGAASVETSVASLQGGEVGGAAIGHFTNAQELLAQAAAAFRAGQDELQNHLNVKEAYDANPDAGNKQFVTSE